MSRKHKTNSRRTGLKAGSSHIHRRVKAMAAQGLVEDQIALRIGGDKNQLRRRYIDSIKQGRAAAQEERAAAELTKAEKKEQQLRETIARTFKSHWYSPETGHLLFGGTHSVDEAIEWGRREGGWVV